jgi:histidinol-phosphate phosphatase family protein
MEANTLPPPPPPAAPGDVIDPAHIRLLPGAADACARLQSAGFTLIVFSNQGTVARGGATCQRIDEINHRLAELLEHHARWDRPARGPMISAFYYCPYHPQGRIHEFTREHPWRKPAPGMILAAAADHELDLAQSWVIGDAPRDIEAGIAAGIPAGRCLLVRAADAQAADDPATEIPARKSLDAPIDFPSIRVAADHILRNSASL